jgi:multicomponent Na+:H+ antiporter subunit A
MAGLPPLLGFISKEVAYEGALGREWGVILITAAAVTANALVVAVAGLVAVRPFFGALVKTPKKPHEAPVSLWLGPVLLAVLGLVFGLFPMLAGTWILIPAMEAILQQPVNVYFVLWHGLNLALALSVLTLALGVLIYANWSRVNAFMIRLDPLLDRGPEHGYDRSLDGLNWIARTQTQLIQTGYLRSYLFGLFVVTTVAVGGTMILRGGLPQGIAWGPTSYYDWGIAALILCATAATLLLRSRLGAITALGVVGFGVALIFLLFGAPDVAMTQFLVETLVVIIVALLLWQLPPFPQRRPPFRARDAVVALAAGTVTTLVLLAATAQPFDPFITEYFAEASYPLAHGRNIVNVILVDFRALDTLGEITVVAAAGLGAFALIKLRARRSR